MTMSERLLEVGSQLPPPALAELIGFVEFLRQKATFQQLYNLLALQLRQ